MMNASKSPNGGNELGDLEYLQVLYLRLKEVCESPNANNLDKSRLFCELIQLILNSSENLVDRFEHLPELRQLCATSEYELEIEWSKISANYRNLTRFPYFQNYLDLMEMEMSGKGDISGFSNLPYHSKILFVGSGPLPLSSILMSKKYNCLVTNLDKSELAIQCSRELYHRLDVQADFITDDLMNLQDFRAYDMVILAALVGVTEKEKTLMIQHILSNANKGMVLLARNAHGNKRLIYPPISEASLLEFADVYSIVPPASSSVLNSALFIQQR